MFRLSAPHQMGIGFGYVAKMPLLPPCCGLFFVLELKMSFLVGSSVFLLMIIQQLVVFLVFL